MEIEPKKIKKTNKTLSRNVLNVIRTTMRNNIELTHIADNKANVLLSLNALMLTFLLPIIISNIEFIKEMQLGLALVIFVITCLVTIHLSAVALRPGDFSKLEKERGGIGMSSPFFFAHSHKMTADDFEERINKALMSDETVRKHITQDLYFIAARLGQKMTLIRTAFNFFLIGLVVSVTIASIIMLFFN
jgi:hypothetical protein